jgi:hypothetical protein
MEWYYRGEVLDRWETEPEVWEDADNEETFGEDLEEK